MPGRPAAPSGAIFSGNGAQVPETVANGSENPIKSGVKTGLKPDRPWRQIAGPPMASETLRLATLGTEQIARSESEHRSRVETYLHNPDPARATRREVAYVALRSCGHGSGQPTAVPATRCDWVPSPTTADCPDIPEFLRRPISG